jgi:hypothetical protein
MFGDLSSFCPSAIIFTEFLNVILKKKKEERGDFIFEKNTQYYTMKLVPVE